MLSFKITNNCTLEKIYTVCVLLWIYLDNCVCVYLQSIELFVFNIYGKLYIYYFLDKKKSSEGLSDADGCCHRKFTDLNICTNIIIVYSISPN